MPDFVTLSCPTCGGQLRITQDIDRFACAHCGSEHVVKRGGGIVSLAPVVQGLDDIRRGTDRIAAELAIPRLEKEVDGLDEEMLELAHQLCMSDLFGMQAEVDKLDEWKREPDRRPSGTMLKGEAVKLYQEFIVGLSADEMEQLGERFLNRFRLFGAKPGDAAAFETMIGLKRKVDENQAGIERHKRDLAADY